MVPWGDSKCIIGPGPVAFRLVGNPSSSFVCEWVGVAVRRRGWIKTVGGLRKTRHRGTARVGWLFTLTATACNLVRLPKLLATG